MSKLSESLDALNEQIAAFEPDLEKKREPIEEAIKDLVQLKEDVQTEEARLKAVPGIGRVALTPSRTFRTNG